MKQWIQVKVPCELVALLVMKRDELKRLSGRSKEEIRDFYIPLI